LVYKLAVPFLFVNLHTCGRFKEYLTKDKLSP
jgi:hypothetical protein